MHSSARIGGAAEGFWCQTLAEVGENIVLDILRTSEATEGDSSVGPDLVGNGDDAAVLGPSSGTAISTDMLVEGTHFRSELSSWREIGRRAIAQNVSDIAAMGVSCSRLLVAIAAPGTLRTEQLAQLAEGIHVEAARYGAAVVGGDFTSAPIVVLTVTAIGQLAPGENAVRMDGARPGDIVAITGYPGRSAAGFELLEAGYPDGVLQDIYRVPAPPMDLGIQARLAGATAMTDISDGLLRDCAHLCRASSVTAELEYSALGEDPELEEAARVLDASNRVQKVHDWKIAGGEDHGLMATYPPAVPLPEGFRAIGRVKQTAPRGGELGTVLLDGLAVDAGGWDSASSAHLSGR